MHNCLKVFDNFKIQSLCGSVSIFCWFFYFSFLKILLCILCALLFFIVFWALYLKFECRINLKPLMISSQDLCLFLPGSGGTKDLRLLKSNFRALEYLKLSCGPCKRLSSSGSHFLVESILSEFQSFQVPNSWWALDTISAPLSLWSCPKCHSASQPPLVELANAPMSSSSSKNGLTFFLPLDTGC